MSVRDAIIDEIKTAPESLARETYDFSKFLKRRRTPGHEGGEPETVTAKPDLLALQQALFGRRVLTTSQICSLLILFGGISSARTLDLSGEWRIALDPSDLGIAAKPADWKFPDKIHLPGIVTAQGFGETPNFKTQWTGDGWRYPDLFKEWQTDDKFKFPFFLQPPKHYVGPAWYQREIGIPEDWQGAETVLHMERVHWLSTAWIDGKVAGKGDSLGTPHEFNLGKLSPGKHTLTLRIDNRLDAVNVGPLSHSVTDHTQGNWNF